MANDFNIQVTVRSLMRTLTAEQQYEFIQILDEIHTLVGNIDPVPTDPALNILQDKVYYALNTALANQSREKE